MKVLYISTYVDADLLQYIDSVSKNKPAISAIKYTELIKDGLKENMKEDVTNLFLPTIAMYPQSKIKYFSGKKTIDGKYIPFVNLIILKQIWITIYITVFGLLWGLKNLNKERIIILSSLNSIFLAGVFPLKLWNIKIVSFVPDLPINQFKYTLEKKSIKSFLAPLYVRIPKLFYHIIDFYVFITKYMIQQFPQRPYKIIEGFVDHNSTIKRDVIKAEKFTIMYAGALNEKFGIRLLLESFVTISEDIELWLFGEGDMIEEIRLYAGRDARIKFFGRVSNTEIIEYEYKAHILINPRFTFNDFTKYSFPSKLMEYMMTGTPVLTTCLAGIPDDYLDKMYFIPNETVDGLKDSILKCFKKSEQERFALGAKAQTYVLTNKNNILLISIVLNEILNYNA